MAGWEGVWLEHLLKMWGFGLGKIDNGVQRWEVDAGDSDSEGEREREVWLGYGLGLGGLLCFFLSHSLFCVVLFP